MIKMANVGIGIRGKEGQQASLAADFSVENFYALKRLLLWHGRNNFQRSANLTILLIHRGLVYTVCQTLFSCLLNFVSVSLFQNFLFVGYPTIYTAFLLASIVLDTQLPEATVLMYPELY